MENFEQNQFNLVFTDIDQTNTNPSNQISSEDTDIFLSQDEFNLYSEQENNIYNYQQQNDGYFNEQCNIVNQPLFNNEKPIETKSKEKEIKQVQKSKRIQKRQVAKERTQAKQQIFKETTSSDGLSTSGESKKDSEKLSKYEAQKKKQMIRNRASAQNSRDRKKNQMKELEYENKDLSEENYNLKQQLSQMDTYCKKLEQQNHELQQDKENWQQKALNPTLINDNEGEIISLAPRETLSFNQSGMFGLMLLTIFAVLLVFNGGQSNMMENNNYLIQTNMQQIGFVNNGIKMNLVSNKREKENLLQVSNIRELLIKELYYQTLEKLKPQQEVVQQNIVDYYQDDIRDDAETGLVPYNGESILDGEVIANMPGVSTVFCQKPFKFQGEDNFQFQDDDLVQFIVPKSEMKLFINQGDEVFKSQNSQIEDNYMYEILAKISSIRELKL